MSPWHKNLSQFVTESRRSQGLPARVKDPAVLAQIVRLLRSKSTTDPKPGATEKRQAEDSS